MRQLVDSREALVAKVLWMRDEDQLASALAHFKRDQVWRGLCEYDNSLEYSRNIGSHLIISTT